MMYVSILWITNDKTLTEEIMSLLFVQLKTDKTLLSSQQTLCLSLLCFTYSTAYKMLKISQIRCKNRDVRLESHPTLTEFVKDSTDITEANAKAKLRLDVQKIRDKYAQKIKDKTAKKQVQKPVVVFDFTEKEFVNAN